MNRCAYVFTVAHVRFDLIGCQVAYLTDRLDTSDGIRGQIPNRAPE